MTSLADSSPATAATVETWSGKDRGDENFPVGSFLIHPRLRPVIHAFYRFARNADDIADHADLTPDDKLARLDMMRAIISGDGGTDAAPSASDLLPYIKTDPRILPHALDLLQAFRQDATKNRYDSWQELYDYCRYSAMPVGRFMLDQHGESPDLTYGPSDALCTVLQILNHLQDAQKDLRALDRCYYPCRLLGMHGASVADLNQPREAPGLRSAKLALLDRCDALIQQAILLPSHVADRRLRLECAIIVDLATRLAVRLRRQDTLAGRVKLTLGDMIGAAASSLQFFKKPQ